MSRTPSTLSALARAGFAELDRAKGGIEALGVDPGEFQVAADPDLSLATVQALRERDGTAWKKIWAQPESRQRLIILCGVSQGLGEFLKRRPDTWKSALEPLATIPDQPAYAGQMRKALVGLSGPDTVVALRVAYRTHLCRLALWDASHPDPIEVVPAVAGALADLAGAVLDVALELARREHGIAGDAAPLSIIGMGKAGARELNYLSDVDVIYVTEVPDGQDPEAVIRGATALARETARIITEFGVEPGLWEVDANLRPEGKDGALVRTLESHVAYYERWAHDWEFQALIKSRPLAGDIGLGERYRAALEPLIWSASGREGFVEQVQRMRERVTDNIPPEDVDYQIKLGPGGLRDIEFTIQLLQLVHGSVDPGVRQRDTLGALRALSSGGYVGRPEAQEFDHAYRLLRLLEHRIQLAKLKRSHLMPRDDEAVRVLARSTKLADSADALVEAWRGIQRAVRGLHERLFYRPLLSAVAGLGGEGVELTSEQAAARLQASGFRNPTGALHHIQALTQGVSRRAQIQRTLLPVLLSWIAKGTDPDGGLLAFRQLSDDLGEAFWFLRMLRDSSGAAERLTSVLSTSGYVAKLFGRIPEGAAWLDDDQELHPRSAPSLREEIIATLERHRGDQDAAQKALRQLRRRELLRLALGSMVGIVDIRSIGHGLSDLAGEYLQGVLELARDGEDGIEFAIFAMGRFGGRELGFGSDLDVIYVYRDAGAGEGAQAAADAIVKRVIALSEDVLFPVELDAGLRPEGKNGPMVRSLEAYEQYYQRWALGWEAQALLRAADIAGDAPLCADFLAMAAPIRYPASFGEDEVREIRRIKARVEAERLPQGADPHRHVKLGRGSLSDVEWVIQLIQLQQGHTYPDIRTPSSLDALSSMAEHGLVGETDRRDLETAWLMASRVRTAMTLFSGKTSDVLPSDRASLEGVARLMGYPPRSAAVLEEDYLRDTRRARAVFERLFYGKKNGR